MPLIVSNHEDARPLAAFHGIPFHYIPVAAGSKTAAEAAALSLLDAHGIELIVLARYMQVLSDAFVAAVSATHHQRAPLVPAGVHRRPPIPRRPSIAGSN